MEISGTPRSQVVLTVKKDWPLCFSVHTLRPTRPASPDLRDVECAFPPGYRQHYLMGTSSGAAIAGLMFLNGIQSDVPASEASGASLRVGVATGRLVG
jgi:hypothetical protein